MSHISELTLQQEEAIAIYKEKWRQKAFCTQPIDRDRVSSIINLIYRDIFKNIEPEIFFLDSPLPIANLSFLNYLEYNVDLCNPKKLNNVLKKAKKELLKASYRIDRILFEEIIIASVERVGSQLDIKLWHQLQDKFHFWSPLTPILFGLRDRFKTSSIWQAAKPVQRTELEGLWCYASTGLQRADNDLNTCALFDFCTAELGCSIDEKLWDILKKFISELGWVFLYQDFCFVCDRPCHISIDDESRLHSECEPAVKFRDGFSISVHHGELYSSAIVPEK